MVGSWDLRGWWFAGLLPLVACVGTPGVGEERVYDTIEFDYGTADGVNGGLAGDVPALRTNAENLEVQHLSTDFAPGLRVTEVGVFSEMHGGLPLVAIFVTVQNSGDVTYCRVKLDSTFTTTDGDLIASASFGALDGPRSRVDSFVDVCLRPGDQGIATIIDRPEQLLNIDDVAHATFEVTSFLRGKEIEPIDGPSIESLQALHKPVRNSPPVYIETLAGTLRTGVEALGRLSITAYVRDERGFFRDRAHGLLAESVAPNEGIDFELRGYTLTRTEASEVRSVRVTFGYELERDSL